MNRVDPVVCLFLVVLGNNGGLWHQLCILMDITSDLLALLVLVSEWRLANT